MTESKRYDIITKEFDGNQIDFIERDEDIWITAETLGIGLEYSNPRKSVMNLYFSHKDEIEEYKGVIELMTPGGIQETTVFNEMGAYLLIMFSNQPKAKEFRKWVIRVIKNIRKKGYHIEPSHPKGSIEWIIQTLDTMKAVALKQQEQEQFLEYIKQEQNEMKGNLKELQEKDRYIFVTPRTKRILRDEVHRVAIEYMRGLHGKVWNPLKAHYHVSKYEEFKEEDAQTIIKVLKKNYPPKTHQEV